MFKVLSVLVIATVTFLSVNAEQVSVFNLLSKAARETNQASPLMSAVDRGNLGRCDSDPDNFSYFFDQVRKLSNTLNSGDTFQCDSYNPEDGRTYVKKCTKLNGGFSCYSVSWINNKKIISTITFEE